jgi:hypothetical protein
MTVRIGATIQLPSCNLNSVIIPGDYVLPSGNTYANFPPELTGRTIFMQVKYENFNTTLLSQELKPVTGAQSIFRRTGSQASGSLLHGTFGFNVYYSFTGTVV